MLIFSGQRSGRWMSNLRNFKGNWQLTKSAYLMMFWKKKNVKKNFLILQNVSGCLVPYLVEQIISVVGSIGTLVYIGIKSFTKPEDVDAFFSEFLSDEYDERDFKMLKTIAIVLVVLLTIETIYAWIVIFSLYQEITAFGHKVQDSVFLDTYPQHSIANYPANQNLSNIVLGNYPPPSHLSMDHYPANLNVGINSYPSNPNQNHGNNAPPDGLAFTYQWGVLRQWNSMVFHLFVSFEAKIKKLNDRFFEFNFWKKM